MPKNTNLCFAFARPKSASIFFDKVIPIHCEEFVNFELPLLTESYSKDDLTVDICRAFLDGLRGKKEIVAEMVFGTEHPGWDAVDDLIETIYDTTFSIQSEARFDMEADGAAFMNAQYVLRDYHPLQQIITTHETQRDFKVYGSGLAPTTLLNDLANCVGASRHFCLFPEHPESYRSPSDTSEFEVSINLANLPLIDEDQLSWQQVIEIRRDEGAKRRILRLEKFVEEAILAKLTDTSKFVDEIELHLEDHIAACQKHGIETNRNFLSAVVDVRTLASSAATWFAAGKLSVDPSIGLSLAGVIHVANIAVEFSRSRRLKSDFLKLQPMTFLANDLNLSRQF